MVTAVVWLLTVVVAVLAVFVVGLLRSYATTIRALHDAGIVLDPDREEHSRAHDHGHASSTESGASPAMSTTQGVPAPAEVSGRRAHDLAGTTASGGSRAVAVTSTTGSTLIAFLTTGCSTCAEFWRSFAEGVALPGDTRLVVVTRGPEAESPADVAAVAAPHVVTLMSSQAWDDYGIPVAPYFVLVDGTRGVVVGEGAASSWELVQRLLAKAVADGVHSRPSRRDILLGRARESRIDSDLLAAGISPGAPELFHEPAPETEETDR